MKPNLMKHVVVATMLSLLAIGSTLAQAQQPIRLAQDATCEIKAVGKDGKPLVGAAKASFLKKCKTDACTDKAVGSDGKPLAGAAKASFLKKCEADA
jgi:hypothetical protein